MRLNARALTYATIAVIWLSVVMAIGTEVSEPFKTFLTNLAGHHWIAKSLIDVVAFVLLYVMFKGMREGNAVLPRAFAVIVSAILSGCAIFFYYVYHFLNS